MVDIWGGELNFDSIEKSPSRSFSGSNALPVYREAFESFRCFTVICPFVIDLSQVPALAGTTDR